MLLFRWAAGPELFGAAGYERCVYLDGDVLAATSLRYPGPPLPPRLSGPSSLALAGRAEGHTASTNSSSRRSDRGPVRRLARGWRDGVDGGFSCGLLRAELAARVDGDVRAAPPGDGCVGPADSARHRPEAAGQTGAAPGVPGGAELERLPLPSMAAGAVESSLGVMLAALGASDADYAAHHAAFGVRKAL